MIYTLASALAAPASSAVVISDAYTPELAPGQGIGAAYFTLRNTDTVPHVVTGASAPVAGSVELHASVDTGGIHSMVQQHAVSIPAGGEQRFEPGGLHVMLMGVQGALSRGQSYPLALTFEDGTRLTVAMRVTPIR